MYGYGYNYWQIACVLRPVWRVAQEGGAGAGAGKATFCGSARAPHKRAPPALLRDRVVRFGLELLAEPSQMGPYMQATPLGSSSLPSSSLGILDKVACIMNSVKVKKIFLYLKLKILYLSLQRNSTKQMFKEPPQCRLVASTFNILFIQGTSNYLTFKQVTEFALQVQLQVLKITSHRLLQAVPVCSVCLDNILYDICAKLDAKNWATHLPVQLGFAYFVENRLKIPQGTGRGVEDLEEAVLEPLLGTGSCSLQRMDYLFP